METVMIRNREFVKLLVSKGILTEQDSRSLIMKYGMDDFSILTHLVREGVAPRSDLARLWGDSLKIPYVDLTKVLFQRQVVEKLPASVARKNRIMLLYQFGDAITAATWNPTNRAVIQEAESIIGCPISPVFTFPEDIEDAIEIQYQSYDSLKELCGKIDVRALLNRQESEITREELAKLAGDESVVEFTRAIMLIAVKERASDIHIEPGEDMVRIRFRIDGSLQERMKLHKGLLPPLVSRLKILANLDISERRRPQDGHIRLQLSNRSLDLRASFVPTIFGEKVVLRILGQIESEGVPDMTELGFSALNLGKLQRALQVPNGIFLVTGPTGSGKTTTLYSILKYLNKNDVNIVTVEDPVEYRMAGINQVQVNPVIGLDFATALRSFLRQDPDIILLGEIRDVETARIASQAALTGHLVMATLHTNSAAQAITRIVDIGVEPYLVAATVVGVMAQRLVRRICEHCKEKYALSPEEMDRLFVSNGRKEAFFYRGRGCPQCNNTGYSGRMALHEIFLVNDEIRTLIARGATILEIQQCLRKEGFQSLRYDGLKKVLRGLTTIEEIDSAVMSEY
jgi:type IV pilus assembly protein PilB